MTLAAVVLVESETRRAIAVLVLFRPEALHHVVVDFEAEKLRDLLDGNFCADVITLLRGNGKSC